MSLPCEHLRGLTVAAFPSPTTPGACEGAYMRERVGWRYDRLADGVERVTGQPAMSVREFVSLHADEFGGRRS